MSTVRTRRPPIRISRRERFAPRLAADCCQFGMDAKAESIQLQPTKKIPAAAPDSPLKNSLRVGIFPLYFSQYRYASQAALLYRLWNRMSTTKGVASLAW